MIGTQARKRIEGREALRTAIAKDFSGGLNTFDSPLNLSSRYLTELRNLYPDPNGRLRVRYGTTQFATVASTTDIIGLEYYINSLIAVGENGGVWRIAGDGTVTALWTQAIAATRPGAPAGWSSGLKAANFAQFGGNLIIVNGVDKPLILSPAFVMNYLADLGTGANANVPRARYVVTHNNYLVMAVTPTDSTTLYITNKGTSGTFFGDPAPNDAVNFNTSTYIMRGVPEITGLGSFRDKLIVTFDENIMPVQLGTYADDAHVPKVTDVIENHGAISHRCIVPLGDDIVFLDKAGVASVQRALITATLTPVRESTLVSKDIQASLAKFSQAALSDEAFAVHDRLQQQVMFFIPKSTTVAVDTDNDVFVYCFDKSQKFRAMTYYDKMPYRCGTRSADGRVFLAGGNKIWFYRNQFEPLYMDQAIPASQAFSDGTLFDDGTGFFDPGANGTFNGTAIPFAMSTPWSDFKLPEKVKGSRYLHALMEGSGLVTVDMFTDRFTTVANSMLFTVTDQPATPDVASRPLNNDMLYAWPSTFTRTRLRAHGTTSNAFSILSIGLLYVEGGFRR